MAIGALSIALTLGSLGLSAYSSSTQAKMLEKQAKVSKAQGQLNLTKYKMDLQSQHTGVLEEAKMALGQVEQMRAKSTFGVDTASQSLVQGVMGDVAKSESNIVKNIEDAKFNQEVANRNTKMQVSNAKVNMGLNFLGQTLSAGSTLAQAHFADVKGQKLEEGIGKELAETKSQLAQIMENMKY